MLDSLPVKQSIKKYYKNVSVAGFLLLVILQYGGYAIIFVYQEPQLLILSPLRGNYMALSSFVIKVMLLCKFECFSL